RHRDTTGRDRAVRLLPFFQIGSAEPVIAIGGAGLSDVHYDDRSDQLRQRNLLGGGLPLSEVDRAVEVRAAVLAGGVASRRVPVTAWRHAPTLPLELERLSRGPVDRLLVVIVSEIDQLRRIDRRARLRVE